MNSISPPSLGGVIRQLADGGGLSYIGEYFNH